jgi:hypothetical protein
MPDNNGNGLNRRRTNVAGEKKKGVSTRLIMGRYFADIVPDAGPQPFLYHWIVQRRGSAEVLRLGQEIGFSRALEQAHNCLESLARAAGKRARPRSPIYEFGNKP